MAWWEVNRYLAGIRRRYRTQYDTTRWLVTHLANMFRKKGDPPFKPQDVMKFPWEKDQTPAEITDEEMEALQAELAALGTSPTEKAPDES